MKNTKRPRPGEVGARWGEVLAPTPPVTWLTSPPRWVSVGDATRRGEVTKTQPDTTCHTRANWQHPTLHTGSSHGR